MTIYGDNPATTKSMACVTLITSSAYEAGQVKTLPFATHQAADITGGCIDVNGGMRMQ